MSRAATSLLAYGVYLILLGLALLIAPNVPLPLFGLPPTDEVWIRIVGMSVLFLAIYFIQAARHEWIDLFRVSVYLRAAASRAASADSNIRPPPILSPYLYCSTARRMPIPIL